MMDIFFVYENNNIIRENKVFQYWETSHWQFPIIFVPEQTIMTNDKFNMDFIAPIHRKYGEAVLRCPGQGRPHSFFENMTLQVLLVRPHLRIRHVK